MTGFSQHRLYGLVGALALIPLLAACTTEEPVERNPRMQRTAPAPSASESTPDPSPENDSESAAFPSVCEEMLPLDVARHSDARVEAFGQAAPETLESLLGPRTYETVMAGDAVLSCIWGIPNSDGGFTATVAAVSPADAAALTAELRNSVYAETTGSASGAVDAAFQRSPSADHPYTTAIILDDPYLIVVAGTLTGPYIGDIHAQLRG